MSDTIWIKTHRYSELLKRILNEYNKNVQIFIDGYAYTERDIPYLINSWAANSLIQKTTDFTLIRNGTTLFGFHDTPDNFWAALTERNFVEQLAAEKILKYRVMLDADIRRIRPAKRLSQLLLKYVFVNFRIF